MYGHVIHLSHLYNCPQCIVLSVSHECIIEKHGLRIGMSMTGTKNEESKRTGKEN